jgi:cell division protein FtsB
VPPKVIKRRWFLKPIPIIAMLAVIGFGLWFSLGESGLWNAYQLRKTRAAQAEQIRELEARKKELADYLAALKAGDDVTMERAARERNLAAPNETIYDIKVEPKK